jgi:amphi-Trp domain-containing protein
MPKKANRSRDVTIAVSRSTFVRQLRRLADRLEAGSRFDIRVGKERISIPPGYELSIEHEREGLQEELEFQIRWTSRPKR